MEPLWIQTRAICRFHWHSLAPRCTKYVNSNISHKTRKYCVTDRACEQYMIGLSGKINEPTKSNKHPKQPVSYCFRLDFSIYSVYWNLYPISTPIPACLISTHPPHHVFPPWHGTCTRWVLQAIKLPARPAARGSRRTWWSPAKAWRIGPATRSRCWRTGARRWAKPGASGRRSTSGLPRLVRAQSEGGGASTRTRA